eukprot:CAMPEP_0204896170 /NCGR_PEP_ID=MMETSP1397-20131031/3_1 /ASSEMBLY_ACC=CAM_ASM_000891 /TAXON_ID=49980 /ORGANISM="Climacostomum Climacostomum virens, Strain Stock W-24" /LENGTH=178 /DNA_ID=CAMNT_0052063737 /DNA_START=80 /DNA_END=612 /DNA_ORIENTATION=-
MKRGSNKLISTTKDGVPYSLGDVVRVMEMSDNEAYATILSIKASKRTLCNLQVRWFYKPGDVFSAGSAPSFISSRELFDSNHLDTIPLSSITGKVGVLTFDEFFSCDIYDPDTFFTRAKCDCRQQLKLSPSLLDWPKGCTCSQVINPDLTYYKCLSCFSAYHVSCISSMSDCPSCGAG